MAHNRNGRLYNRVVHYSGSFAIEPKKLVDIYVTDTCAGLPPMCFAVQQPNGTWLIGMYGRAKPWQDKWLRGVKVLDHWEGPNRGVMPPAVEKLKLKQMCDGNRYLLDLVDSRFKYFSNTGPRGKGHNGTDPIKNAESLRLITQYCDIKSQNPSMSMARIARRIGVPYEKLYPLKRHYHRWIQKRLDKLEKEVYK